MMNTDKNFALLMVFPALAVMLIMTVWPMLSTIYYSFTDFRLLRRNISFITFSLMNTSSLQSGTP